MRALFWPTLFWWGFIAALFADEQMVERFDGHNSLITSDFTVPDHWEIRWHSEQALSVGVIRLNNSVVAGASGMNSGSLYLPKGGTFRIRVTGEDPIPWDVVVVALGPVDRAPAKAPDDSETGTYYIPSAGPEDTNAAPEEADSPGDDTAATPSPTPSPTPTQLPTQLTAEQEQAIVTIKGDRAEGGGFLLETSGGTVVMTTLSLLAHNPNLSISDRAGRVIEISSLQGATDRDLAMIGVKGAAGSKLQLATDFANTVQTGDALLTAANASTAAPVDQGLRLLAIGPQRLALDHLQGHPEVGGPILQASSGRVVAVLDAAAPTVDTGDLDKISFVTRESAAARLTDCFGLRVDNVAGWEAFDWNRFEVETAFLDQFRETSLHLDSYLNAGNKRMASKLWTSNDKIKTANDNFVQDSAGGDNSQRMAAMRSLLFELNIVADTDRDQIQQPANFYTFDQQRARDELAYRQALKAELDGLAGDLPNFSVVLRRINADPTAPPDNAP
jgi:hypothetical protein